MKKTKKNSRLEDGFHSVVKQMSSTDADSTTGEHDRVAAGQDKRERFLALIEGEYRDEFGQMVSQIVRRRLRDNAELLQERDRLRADWDKLRSLLHERIAQAQAAHWQREEEWIRTRYPQFSLRQEMENPDFLRLLTDRIHPLGMLRAYESIHFEELRAAFEQEARERAESAFRLRTRRPNESGAAPQSGIPQHAALTRADRAALAKRAMRGERIVL